MNFQKYLQEDVAPALGISKEDQTAPAANEDGAGSSVVPSWNLALDNARFHKATNACIANGIPTIAQTADNAGITLRYTAPYCPQLNPVEHANSVMKNYVRKRRPKTEGELCAAVQASLSELTSAKVNRMFEHCFLRAEMPSYWKQRTLHIDAKVKGGRGRNGARTAASAVRDVGSEAHDSRLGRKLLFERGPTAKIKKRGRTSKVMNPEVRQTRKPIWKRKPVPPHSPQIQLVPVPVRVGSFLVPSLARIGVSIEEGNAMQRARMEQ